MANKNSARLIIDEVMTRAVIGYPPTDERDNDRTMNEALAALSKLIVGEIEELYGKEDDDNKPGKGEIYNQGVSDCIKAVEDLLNQKEANK